MFNGYTNVKFFNSIFWPLFVQLLQAIQVAERLHKPPLRDLFTDVYDQVPNNLRDQENLLRQTIKKHPADYPSDIPL